MSTLGFKSIVYHGDLCLGEVQMFPAENSNFQFPENEIRINYLSLPSERCPPLSVLQTISPFTVRCKLDVKSISEQSQLHRLYVSCLTEPKTAVVLIGNEELHLVAMQGKVEAFPCFWCCAVPIGLYASCLGMLNLRCLAIVFDLDETLIVANTMKSFEDRIEFLQRRIACETDVLRASGMKAELKRYWDDKALLKQFSENDHVLDNGKLIQTQLEELPSLSDNQDQVVRPIIRLPDRNIVLTRINPEIRDTSVLVRLRPAWEDLRSYLTAKGRKRFEVYVCTMAERDYALEMWRLLDPEAHLISSKQLMDRIVCVKSGSRKSLLNVFQDGICHPRMAMVIDDRLNVWDDNDQPRVHVVPAFTPYYAPQAEMAYAVPVLCVARNVACNVRGGFFKEFDENLLRRIFELRYEDEVKDLPSAPDVRHYLMSEDPGFVPNGNREIPVPEGMSGAEVDRRLNRLESNFPFVSNGSDLRTDSSQQPLAASSNHMPALIPRPNIPLHRPGLLGAAPREGEISLSEIERRRLLILQHGQDTRNYSSPGDPPLVQRPPGDPPLVHRPSGDPPLVQRPPGDLPLLQRRPGDPPLVQRPPAPISVMPTQRHGGWLVAEEDIGAGQPTTQSLGLAQEPDALLPDKDRAPNPFHHSTETSIPSGQPHNVSVMKSEEAYVGDERHRQNHLRGSQSSGDDEVSHTSISNGGAGTLSTQPSALSISVLQEIGRRCVSKVEFRSVVSASKDLQFSVEVLFNGEKMGTGMGRTRKEAQLQAADNALHSLASMYVADIGPDCGPSDRNFDGILHERQSGFLMDTVSSSGFDESSRTEELPTSFTPEQLGLVEYSKRLSAVVTGIEELGLSPVFQDQPPASITLSEGLFYCQVEIGGQVVGKGVGPSKEDAKLQVMVFYDFIVIELSKLLRRRWEA
ncbi:RNA polymerase II C-terminal domain phosphatase-like 2 isoform X2 [Aristolochia californica]|uniref:RNA polymerase II C-terminal domain phosphatase-like 2 isoform X2 n=1 Tax=Aristolochia californica TaxID=171875 RepID=UPI0035DF87CE